jgi:uncharacterized protein YkwD
MPLSRRNRIIVIAAAAVIGAAGLGAGSAYAASAAWHGGGPKAHATASHGSGHGSGSGSGYGGPGHADQPPAGAPSGSTSPTGDPSGVPSTTPTPAGTPTVAPAPGRTTPKTSATTKTPTKKPTTTAPAAPAQNPSGNQAAIQGVFAQLNQLRATNGLPALALSTGLIASAHVHNLTMINGCGLSHQCPGEAPFGDRISAQGVTWTSAAENIGDGGKIANNDAAITEAAEGQTTGMYNEVAPNDGHRQNILGKSYGHVGIDVVIDNNGIVWMTQDFTN